jgi:CHAT domain-containing protein/tetratricopeptide (TPR) repeat protein
LIIQVCCPAHEPGASHLKRKDLSYCLQFLAMMAVGLLIPLHSFAQAVDPVITQEYFIQQPDDEDLLITISAFEAEFESKISGPGGETLLQSAIRGSRIVPIFQYLYAPRSRRQIDIEVTSSLHTERTEFGIELTRLKPWDSRSSSVSQAYKMLSFGTEVSADDSQVNWTVKINSLVKAGQLFEQYGMLEMGLWANYLTAHLIHFHLHDHAMVYNMTRKLLGDLRGTRLEKIALATLQLQSLALIGLKRSGSLEMSPGKEDPVQVALSQAAGLAESMGYYFEQARALYASGVEYAEQSLYPEALEQFQLAVKAADSVGSAELATEIRESIVQIHTVQGDSPATSEVLQEIESQLVEDGAGDELALNLLAQARLLMANYHYGEAFEVLTGALSHENNSAIRRQINFELAKIFHETGRLDDALQYLKLADINPDNKQRRRQNPVVDIGQGLGILADTYRMRADYQMMQAARRAQGRYQVPADQFLYDQGLDAVASAGKGNQQAAAFFRKSFDAATKTGHDDLKHLSRMQYCANTRSAGGICSNSSLKSAYEWLKTTGRPRLAAEAMFLRAQTLENSGSYGEALVVMDQLLDEIHLLRHSLAGSLGAWYWERREQVFETSIRMLLADSKRRNSNDGAASLLALSKIRFIESYTGVELALHGEHAKNDPLRVLLAEREDTASGTAAGGLAERINSGLESLRIGFRNQFEFLSGSGLQRYLRTLKSDEMVLTYHLSPAIAQAWVAHKGRVVRRDIARPAALFRTLKASREGLDTKGLNTFNREMEGLGDRLLTPIADLLKEKIYWIPAGPLLGFPVDALRFNGRYLVEGHDVLSLLSFPVNTDPHKSLKVNSLQNVFLAGNPQDYSGDYATRLETSREIRAVTDIFVGPGLQIIQGVALLPDEFESMEFLQSNVAHLSMPGLINLKYPYESGLELSESEYEPGRLVLRPAAIRSQELSAELVFLSSTRTTENPLSNFSSHPGLVSGLIDAGAGSVIANLWAGNEGSGEGFITDFYRTLQSSGDIAVSFRESRLRNMNDNRADGLYDWAGYQLYIR